MTHEQLRNALARILNHSRYLEQRTVGNRELADRLMEVFTPFIESRDRLAAEVEALRALIQEHK